MAAPIEADLLGQSVAVVGGRSGWVSFTGSSASPGIGVPICPISRQYTADTVVADRTR